MFLFNRSISVNVRSVNKKIISVDVFFLDSYHELCLTLDVDLISNRIISAAGELHRAPHSDCMPLNNIKNLTGIDLNHHVRKQVQAAVGSECGCTHLTDLTIECIKGVVQAKFGLMKMQMGEDDFKPKIEKYLAGTCQHYKKLTSE